jgi:hypothetical protein
MLLSKWPVGINFAIVIFFKTKLPSELPTIVNLPSWLEKDYSESSFYLLYVTEPTFFQFLAKYGIFLSKLPGHTRCYAIPKVSICERSCNMTKWPLSFRMVAWYVCMYSCWFNHKHKEVRLF